MKWINYTEAGYDQGDGLTGGRWMRDQWGVLVYVKTDIDKARATAIEHPKCPDCSGPRRIDSVRCRRCANRARAGEKRSRAA